MSKLANKIYSILDKEYPETDTALEYKNAIQLLVSTILSAQCTDIRVNAVTKELFKKYRNVKDFAEAKTHVFEQEIKSTGFYKNKAKNIVSAAKIITKRFQGKVPRTMEELITLPGVARKTGNIVLNHAYGKIEGIAVDTHVKRVSGRLGLTSNTDPVEIEKDLMSLFKKEQWGKLSNLLIDHGRAICKARKPDCGPCVLNKMCPSADI